MSEIDAGNIPGGQIATTGKKSKKEKVDE